MRRFLIAACGLAVLFGGFKAYIIHVERGLNPVATPHRPVIGDRARAIHKRVAAVDLHADSLLFDRDLNQRGSFGHVDVPRMLEGGVALTVFSIVSKSPSGLNFDSNEDKRDQILALAIADFWPLRSWTSIAERALYQCRKLDRFAAGSGGRLALIRTRADLAAYLARRTRSVTAGMLSIEGSHALDGDLANVDRLFDAGVRMMSPAHFFDNEVSGSEHGVRKGGLTPLGREWVRRLESKRIVIDVAHASAATIDDILAMATRPVVVSHTGVRGTCDKRRNLTGDQVRRIAAKGGIFGVAFFSEATCGEDAAAIARSMRYLADLAGVDRVALGSDFDGTVTTPFDAAGLVDLTQELLNRGFGEEEILAMMGGNALRFLGANLP